MNDNGWTARVPARATCGHERLALNDRQHWMPIVPDRIHERYIEHTWAIQPPLKTPCCRPPLSPSKGGRRRMQRKGAAGGSKIK
eukprot:9485484-Pyramimonas_sp.AAC.1